MKRTISFCNALAACCLTYDNTTVVSLFSFGSFFYHRVKPPQERVDSKRLVWDMEALSDGLLFERLSVANLRIF